MMIVFQLLFLSKLIPFFILMCNAAIKILNIILNDNHISYSTLVVITLLEIILNKLLGLSRYIRTRTYDGIRKCKYLDCI